MGLTH